MFPTAIILILLTCCAGAWITFLRPHPIFPGVPGTDAIVFETDRDGGSQIYIMRADGTYPTRLTYNINQRPAWPWLLLNPWRGLVNNNYPRPAPRDNGVVFLADFEAQPGLYRIGLDGTGQTRLLLPHQVALSDSTVFSPSGIQIAYVNQQGAGVIISANGSDERCLTCMGHAFVMDMTWSPDEQQVAFTMNDTQGGDIYVINVDGSKLRRLTNTPGWLNDQPAWSSDGQHITFRSNRDQGNAEIYVMKADGTDQRRLTITDGAELNPTWSPNGQWLAFAALKGKGGKSDIYIMRTDGSQQTQLTNGGDNMHPAWVRIPASE